MRIRMCMCMCMCINVSLYLLVNSCDYLTIGNIFTGEILYCLFIYISLTLWYAACDLSYTVHFFHMNTLNDSTSVNFKHNPFNPNQYRSLLSSAIPSNPITSHPIISNSIPSSPIQSNPILIYASSHLGPYRDRGSP